MMELIEATEEKMVKLPKEIAATYAEAASVMALSDQKANDERETKKATAMAYAAGSSVNTTLSVGNAHGKRTATQTSRGKRHRK